MAFKKSHSTRLFSTVLNVGSASQLAVIKTTSTATATPSLPASVMAVPYYHTDQLLVAASLSGANTFTTLVDTVRGWMGELGVDTPPESELYERMLCLAESKLDTSLSVQVTLWGERHAPSLVGGVSGARTGNLSLGDVCSATFRGIVENLQSMMPQQIFKSLQVRLVQLRS